MHADPTLVHSVADLRREALLREAAAIARSQPGRRPMTRAHDPARRIVTRLSAAVGWLLTEFEARPCVTNSAASPGRATST